MAVITMPTEEDSRAAFDAYCLALGKVAHAWNYLFEQLGRLFVAIADGESRVTDAIWHTPDSDRIKMKIFENTVTVQPPPSVFKDHDRMKDDLLWIMRQVNNLTDTRNTVIHAPCLLLKTDKSLSMEAYHFTNNDRAKKLHGKSALVEFDWCERWTECISTFVTGVHRSLLDADVPWPDKPGKPDRRLAKDLQPSTSLVHPIQPLLPPQSSLG